MKNNGEEIFEWVKAVQKKELFSEKFIAFVETYSFYIPR